MTKLVTPNRVVEFAYSLGAVVYHRMAEERRPGMVTGLFANPAGTGYYVTWSNGQELKHYEIELSGEYLPDFGAVGGGEVEG